MDAMDRLFEVYNKNFDRLEQKVRRLNRKLGALDVDKMWATRFSREQFDGFLGDASPPTEPKRLFVAQLLHGHEHLTSALPKHLRTLLDESGPESASQRQHVA